MASELDNLVAQRQLKAGPSSAREVDDLLKRSATLLTDARREDLAPEGNKSRLAGPRIRISRPANS